MAPDRHRPAFHDGDRVFRAAPGTPFNLTVAPASLKKTGGAYVWP